MIRSLFLVLVYVSFLGLGLAAPFVFTLGYAWVDTFRPQSVAYIILNQFPVALVMGLAALLGYFFMDRRSPPRLSLPLVLMLLMGFWVTTTLLWAERPDDGWVKWGFAFKTVMFSAFIPLVIRSRVQIEAFAQTYVFALAANFIPFGAKVLITGGGYNRNLGLIGGNGNLAEGGFLSTVCLMAIPLALYLGRHTQLLPRTRLVQLGYLGLAGFALATALGTFERSALVGMMVLGVYMFSRSRNKVLFGLCLAAVVMVIIYSMSKSWTSRMDTVGMPLTEDSALTRLLVWKWTLTYVLSHPFGGGFMLYLTNRIEFPDGALEFGRAYHSIYFEMLGEEGWPGMALFLGLGAWAFFTLRRLARRTRKIPHLVWCADMSDALQSGMAVFLTAGAFVSIAFQPPFWYFIAMSISLREYVRRVEAPEPAAGRRARVLAAAGAVGLPASGRPVAPAAAGRSWQRGASR